MIFHPKINNLYKAYIEIIKNNNFDFAFLGKRGE